MKIYKSALARIVVFVVIFIPISYAAAEEYLIITPSKFYAALNPLVTKRQQDGLTVRVQTLTSIALTYPGRDIQEQIRNCIIFHYKNNDARWVLLVGKPDADDNPGVGTTLNPTVLDKDWEMPIRYVYNPAFDYTYVPTDLYYSGLDGNWDDDGDGKFGEKRSDCTADVDEVDWVPDVHLGRLPVQTVEQLTSLLNKILNSGFEDLTFPQMKALQIQARLEDFSDSGISGKILAQLAEYDPPSINNITKEINSGQYPLVTFTGHATENGWVAGDGSWRAERLAGEQQTSQITRAQVNYALWVAQSFTPQFSKINKVAVFISEVSDFGGGLRDLYVRIRESLDGPDLTAASLPPSQFVLSTFNEIQVPEIMVTPGHTYYLIVDSPETGKSAKAWIGIGSGFDNYPDGTAYIGYESSGWEERSYDLSFKVFNGEDTLFFAYVSACLSAYIDKSNTARTIAEDLLSMENTGAVGYVGALRVSPSFGQNDLWSEFWRSFLERGETVTGRAFSEAQRNFYLKWGLFIDWDYDTWRYAQLIFMFLGDPYVRIGSVPVNGPVITSVPNGIMGALERPYIYDNDNMVEATGTGQIVFQKIKGPVDFAISPDGLITWTVAPISDPYREVIIRATDATGWTDLGWQIDPTGPQEYLCVTSKGNPIAVINKPYAYDADNVPDLDPSGAAGVTWKKLAGPVDLSIHPQTGKLTWTPEQEGTYEILLVAYRGDYGLTFHSVNVSVQPPPPDELAVDFGALGLQHYSDGKWTSLHLSNPDAICGVGTNLYADFGSAGLGLQKYDGASWKRLSKADPEDMCGCGSNLFVDFGAGSGLYKYDGTTLARINSTSPQGMWCVGSKLYVDFGTGVGLYKYDGAWSRITKSSVEDVCGVGSTLYVDYGAGVGLYKYAGTWSRVTKSNPEETCAAGATLYLDFGVGIGLYRYDGTMLTRVHKNSPEKMCAVGSMLYVDFGATGLYKYDGVTFVRVSKSDPEGMYAVGSKLYVDFGASGLYEYDGATLTRINKINSEGMCGVNLE